jgi:hypothetical protein
LCVLEQVSAINCCFFTDSSVLPAKLESCFRKLKSFPLTKPKPLTPPLYTNTYSNNTNYNNSNKADTQSDNGNEEDVIIFSHYRQDLDEKTGSELKLPSGYALSPLDPSDFSMENGAFLYEIRGLVPNLKHGSTSSPSNSPIRC